MTPVCFVHQSCTQYTHTSLELSPYINGRSGLTIFCLDVVCVTQCSCPVLPQLSVLGLLAGGSGECSFPCLCGDDDEGPNDVISDCKHM